VSRVAGPVSAHHGLGTFDARRDITISGTVAGLDFVNPHSWLQRSSGSTACG